MTAQEALVAGVRRLVASDVPGAARDARVLLAHAMEVPQGRLTLVLLDDLAPEAALRFEGLIGRRCRREPVSHLVGKRAFYGRDFIVNAAALDPRPETEVLVEVALSQPFGHVLDLGTGSGCILVTLLAEVPHTVGTGLDFSAAALAVAARNATLNGVSDRAEFFLGDWSWMNGVTEQYDLIVSNPPYVARSEMAGLEPEVRDWEPRMALTDEGDGLGAYRAILRSAPAILSRDGRMLFEIGPTQAEAVGALAEGAGLMLRAVVKDMDGRDRVLVLAWS
ncbi:MAG: peptide chain release factor N(5)-glutamine methyltransferase [Rhodobacterales bacterium]|nr:peptide chain release factor N(5)-glutamine methyltransferase [Rhodobacterales bacterium]